MPCAIDQNRSPSLRSRIRSGRSLGRVAGEPAAGPSPRPSATVTGAAVRRVELGAGRRRPSSCSRRATTRRSSDARARRAATQRARPGWRSRRAHPTAPAEGGRGCLSPGRLTAMNATIPAAARTSWIQGDCSIGSVENVYANGHSGVSWAAGTVTPRRPTTTTTPSPSAISASAFRRNARRAAQSASATRGARTPRLTTATTIIAANSASFTSSRRPYSVPINAGTAPT